MLTATFLHDADGHLAEELLSGSREAFGKLYRQYAPAMLGVITRIVHDNKLAEGLLQQTFMEIWAARATYNPVRERLFTWMMRVGRDIALAASQNNNIGDNNALANPEHTSFVNSNGKILSPHSEDARSRGLSVIEHTAMELLYIRGYKLEDAASYLNTSGAQLKELLRSAMKKLKEVQA